MSSLIFEHSDKDNDQLRVFACDSYPQGGLRFESVVHATGETCEVRVYAEQEEQLRQALNKRHAERQGAETASVTVLEPAPLSPLDVRHLAQEVARDEIRKAFGSAYTAVQGGDR